MLLEDLKATRELLSEPEKWTKIAIARGPDGKVVGAGDPEAVCWCITGAAARVIDERRKANTIPHTPFRAAERQALEDLLITIHTRAGRVIPAAVELTGWIAQADLVAWNDFQYRTHRDILDRLDETIARVEAGKNIAPPGTDNMERCNCCGQWTLEATRSIEGLLCMDCARRTDKAAYARPV